MLPEAVAEPLQRHLDVVRARHAQAMKHGHGDVELPYALERGYDIRTCLLYTSDAADDLPCVDLGGRRIIKKKNHQTHHKHDTAVCRAT